MSMSSDRRKFLKSASVVGMGALIAAAAVPSLGLATDASSGAAPLPTAQNTSTIFAVKITNSLFNNPISVRLLPNELSDPIKLTDGSIYRVSVTPAGANSKFGQVYSLVLADQNGHKLDQMNVGSNTTATFHRFGVQVYMMSIQYANSPASGTTATASR